MALKPCAALELLNVLVKLPRRFKSLRPKSQKQRYTSELPDSLFNKKNMTTRILIK